MFNNRLRNHLTNNRQIGPSSCTREIRQSLIYARPCNVNTNKREIAPSGADRSIWFFFMSLHGFASGPLAFQRCRAILVQVLNLKGHNMNVSSRTVVILNILSATGLLLILAERFSWF
ncbi:stress response membrane protein YncL [Enterobacter sp. 186315]